MFTFVDLFTLEILEEIEKLATPKSPLFRVPKYILLAPLTAKFCCPGMLTETLVAGLTPMFAIDKEVVPEDESCTATSKLVVPPIFIPTDVVTFCFVPDLSKYDKLIVSG
jgi:hypothetical protein